MTCVYKLVVWEKYKQCEREDKIKTEKVRARRKQCDRQTSHARPKKNKPLETDTDRRDESIYLLIKKVYSPRSRKVYAKFTFSLLRRYNYTPSTIPTIISLGSSWSGSCVRSVDGFAEIYSLRNSRQAYAEDTISVRRTPTVEDNCRSRITRNCNFRI